MVMTYFKALRKLQEDCKHVVCKYLCESRLVTNSTKNYMNSNRKLSMKTGNNGDIPLAKFTISTVPFRFVRCPSGQITHAFLAFDTQTKCFEEDDKRQTHCTASQDPLSPACQLDLDSLPAPFTCRNNLQHVPYTLVCDHVHDCRDESDEDFCSFPPCSFADQYQCHNGKECVPLKVRCNGRLDCRDNSDETGCTHKANIDRGYINPPFLLSFEDEIGIGYGYPRLESLTELLLLLCPDTHFRCPKSKNCLPVYMRCNGVFDCSDHEDEMRCDSYTCPSFYRCRGPDVCVHPDDLCDGMVHCPQHDDERFCRLNCSDQCVCFGHSMRCRSPFDVQTFPGMRYLDGRDSGMKMRDMANNSLLIYLNLGGCTISQFDNVTLSNLLILDLSDNEIVVLHLVDLHVMPQLRELLLTRNPLSFILSMDKVHNLEELDMSGGNLGNFDTEVLTSLKHLLVLNLSHNRIEHMDASDFQSLPKHLHVLDARACPLKTFPRFLFEGLDALLSVDAENYKICCKAMLPPTFVSENCQAPFDEISSCEDLLQSNVYRVPLLILASLAVLGNFASFSARVILKRGKGVSGFGVFVLHLCFSDFLMGAYLVFIGVADRVYQGRYLWEDITWRHSAACKLAGFVSMASSEVSAFMICLITLDRFIVLRFPFTRFRFGYSSAQLVSVAVWTTGVVLAAIPLLPATSHWQFYSQTGICIPLPVTRSDFSGHNYAFGVMIILNFFLFLLIAGGQAFVYVSIQSSKMSDNDTSKKSQDATIARRLITVVVSDFLCWFPIGLLGLLANSGIPIPGEVNVAMAVFVLPLNSALNPFLYTLNMIQEYTQKRNEEKLFQEILQKDVTGDNINSK